MCFQYQLSTDCTKHDHIVVQFFCSLLMETASGTIKQINNYDNEGEKKGNSDVFNFLRKT